MSASVIKHGDGNPNGGIGFGIHASGSAYKIVNRRAYHHGTMLISSELGTLGKLLHSNKVPTSSTTQTRRFARRFRARRRARIPGPL
jgi:lipoate-protein ligase A